MGEYVSIKGVGQIKLGTCEDFRYVRRDEMVRLAPHADTRAGRHNFTERQMVELADNAALFFRFPFPEEDEASEAAEILDLCGIINERNMFAPARVVYAPGVEITHQHKTVGFKAPGGGYQVNVYVPCPYSLPMHMAGAAPLALRETGLCSPLPPQALRVVGQKTTGTVFACIYCDAWSRLDEEALTKIRAANRGDYESRLATRFVAASHAGRRAA